MDVAWHAGMMCAYIVLVVVGAGATIYIHKMRHCFMKRVYQLRRALLAALISLGLVRALQMCLGIVAFVTGDRLTPTHISATQITITTLFVIGYWIFFCTNCVVTVIWLQACRRSRKTKMHRLRISILIIVATLLAISLLTCVGLYPYYLEDSFEALNWIISITSILAAVGFSFAAFFLNISLRGVYWKSQLSRTAKRAQKVAATLAFISISSFVARACLNVIYFAQEQLFVGRGSVETVFHIVDYSITELLPGLSLVFYLVFTSHEQKVQMSEFSIAPSHNTFTSALLSKTNNNNNTNNLIRDSNIDNSRGYNHNKNMNTNNNNRVRLDLLAGLKDVEKGEEVNSKGYSLEVDSTTGGAAGGIGLFSSMSGEEDVTLAIDKTDQNDASSSNAHHPQIENSSSSAKSHSSSKSSSARDLLHSISSTLFSSSKPSPSAMLLSSPPSSPQLASVASPSSSSQQQQQQPYSPPSLKEVEMSWRSGDGE